MWKMKICSPLGSPGVSCLHCHRRDRARCEGVTGLLVQRTCRLFPFSSKHQSPPARLWFLGFTYMDCLELNLPYQDLSQTQVLLSFGILSNLLSILHCSPWDFLGDLCTPRGVSWEARAAGGPSPAVHTLPRCPQLRAHFISFGFMYYAVLPNFPP